MAKISPIHGEMSGSIAGNTWSRNRGGQYVRHRRKPCNKQTARQQLVRSRLATLSQQWGTLTDAQRLDWEVWAAAHPRPNALGIMTAITGQQAYNGLNGVCLNCGNARSAVPPTALAPTALTSATIVASTAAQTLVVTFADTPLATGNKLQVWATAPASAGRNPNMRQAKFVGVSAAAQASPATIATLFAFITSQTFNVYLSVVDVHGQVSAVTLVRVTTVA